MTLKRVLIVGVALALFGVVAYGQAQTPRSADRMDELIAEVRGLRGEINQAAGVSIRMQVLVGRLSLQEGRIVALGRQLAEAQSQLAEASRKRIASAEQLARFMNMSENLELTADQHKDVAGQIPNFKNQLAQDQQRELQLQTQVNEISASISAEQGRWQEFNMRLDELERSLGAR